jgi:nicotinate-nucleotide adenylyltransferase
MIALYGGSFDPPHLGHLQLVKTFWKLFPECKKLFLVPNRISPFKENKFSSQTDMIQILDLFLKDISNPNTEISWIEWEREGYTIDTIKQFQMKFPKEEMFFLIGMDNLFNFSQWKDFESILEISKLLVFQRNSYQKELPEELKNFSNRIVFMENDIWEISSSQIRSNLQESKKFLSDSIYSYLMEKKIYDN